MKRRRLAIALAAGSVATMGLLFGGVFSGEPAARDVYAPPPPLVEGVSDPNESLRRLLEGFSTGDTAGFVRTLEANVERDPGDADSLALLGLAYQQRARETGDPAFYNLSETALLRAREARPDQPLVTTGLATLAVARHRWSDALDLARRALDENPEDASALAALGDALLSLGRYEEAFDAFDRSAVLAPSAGSFARVAYARELTGRPREARDALEQVFELTVAVPEHRAWTHLQLGNLLLNTGSMDEAAAEYRAALAELPGYVQAEAGLARVEAARGRLDDAAARLRDVVDRLPTAENAALLAEVLAAGGRQAEADEAFALVEAIGGLLQANGVRTELQTALFELDHDRNVAAALEQAREAYEAAPGIASQDVLAWALFKNGRCEEARGHSIGALRLGTVDARFFFHRGMIERCLGNEAAADRWLARALETNPGFSALLAPVARTILEEDEA
jgi:tetratricopeptide (TPR) repeat protein